jgi:signal transduction histidine kinase
MQMAPSTRSRVLIIGAAFLLVGIVGFVDVLSSVYIAFSIFYLVPIFLAAWYADETSAICVAVAAGFAGLLADLLTLQDLSVDPTYAFANLALRLVLFISVAIVLARFRVAIGREQEVAEREREASERLEELNQMKDRLMRSVVMEAREPLADIYARVVTLGFDMPNLTTGQSREVLNEIADASRRLSELVNTLLDEERITQGLAEPELGAAS